MQSGRIRVSSVNGEGVESFRKTSHLFDSLGREKMVKGVDSERATSDYRSNTNQ